jgi:hypothetical protein
MDSLKDWKEAPERPVFTFPLLFSPNNWTAFVVILRLCGYVPGAEFIRSGFQAPGGEEIERKVHHTERHLSFLPFRAPNSVAHSDCSWLSTKREIPPIAVNQ